MEALRLRSGDRVLDLGCGNGMIAEYISDRAAAHVMGLDYIPVGNLHIMPNVIIKSYAKDGLDDDITGRLTLYYRFDTGKIIIQ